MSARIGLSIILGVLGGIIWGLMFTAYYSMLPNYKFAMIAATVCFVVITIFFLALPRIIKAFKEAAEERKRDDEEDNDEE